MLKAQLGHAAVSEIRTHFGDRILRATWDRPFVFGLGSGSTVAAFWPLFREYLQEIQARHIVIIPTSHQSRELVLASGAGYPLGDINQFPTIDLLVDGFDELEASSGCMIKGGGGAHVLEKLVAEGSKYSIYLGTKDKLSSRLGARQVPIPVEVVPPAVPIARERLIASLNAECRIRPCAGGKIGPIVTDLGNVILDVSIPPSSEAWNDLPALDRRITGVTGVVGCGLFVGLADLSLLVGEGQKEAARTEYKRRK